MEHVGTVCSAYYSIDSRRRESIIARVHGATPEQIENFLLADWPEGAEHQRWLDTADLDEIAHWVSAGLA